MKDLSPQIKSIILADILIFLLSFLGVYNISNKARTPFKIETDNNHLVIKDKEESGEDYLNNDVLLRISGYEITTKEEIEIFMDGKNIGDIIDATLFRNGQIQSFNFTATSHYSVFYTVVAALVGLLFFIVSIIVLLKCDRKNLAIAFHWAFVFTGIIILMTWGSYSKLPYSLGKVTRIAFHIGYLFAPIYFLKFSFLFPQKNRNINRHFFIILILAGVFLSSILSYLFLMYSDQFNVDIVKSYIHVFDISSAFIILLITIAILNFAYSYASSKDEIYRKRTRWILIGFLVGPLGYSLLWVLPTRIWNQAPIPESFILLLVAFVPITFGIAIVKYRIMNVDLIFKRGLIYTTVIATLLLIYSAILAVMAKLINSPHSDVASIIAAVSIALLFQPAKSRVQKFVDKKFFKIEYDYRLALRLFNERIQDIHSPQRLIEKVLELVNSLIPLNHLGYFSYNELKNVIRLEQDINFNGYRQRSFNLRQKLNLWDLISPVSTTSRIEQSVKVSNLSILESDEINNSLTFIVKSESNGIHGFLILGEKRSGAIFTVEDIDLLNIITSRVGLKLDRIKLQEEIMREHLEKEQLEELNKLKSYFVSSVSHDLKTPLTSIKLYAERLRSSNQINRDKLEEYLEIIEGETDRLTRLINNVLDYSKIENGTISYNLGRIDIVGVIKQVIKTLRYQLKIGNFKLIEKYEWEEMFVNGDRDLIAEALVNLISNSIKYHDKKKEIHVSVYTSNSDLFVDVKDFGRGIPEKDIANVFVPFFQSSEKQLENSGGAGLGLTIVKHIMDLHKGIIKVNSKLGEGTTITLIFNSLK